MYFDVRLWMSFGLCMYSFSDVTFEFQSVLFTHKPTKLLIDGLMRRYSCDYIVIEQVPTAIDQQVDHVVTWCRASSVNKYAGGREETTRSMMNVTYLHTEV